MVSATGLNEADDGGVMRRYQVDRHPTATGSSVSPVADVVDARVGDHRWIAGVDGRVGVVTVAAAAEVCNGIDGDCDGSIDGRIRDHRW